MVLMILTAGSWDKMKATGELDFWRGRDEESMGWVPRRGFLVFVWLCHAAYRILVP